MAPSKPQIRAPPSAVAKKKNPNLEDLFVRSLRLAPGGLCVAGIAGCCNRIFKSFTYERTRKILNPSMRFLAGTDRTHKEHDAMAASLDQCRCDLKDPFIAKLHEWPAAIGPRNFAILELAFALMDALSPGPKKRPPPPDERPKDLDQVVLGMTDWLQLADEEDQLGPLPAEWFKPKEPEELEEEDPAPVPLEDLETWPSGPADVFPSPQGLGQTLQNLLHWTAEPCAGSGVFLLISRLSEYSPSFTAEIMSAEMMMPCALVHLQQALDRFDAKNPPETFRLAIASVTHFLHALPTRRLVQSIFDYKALLLELAERIQPALAEMPGAEAAFAKVWWNSLHVGIQFGPSYQWHKFGSPGFDPIAALRIGPADGAQVYNLMRAHRERLMCKKPTCPHRTQSKAKPMMFCRRCALSCYCSSECQKKAWSKLDIPHKGLCNAVDALRRKTGLTDDALWKDMLTRPAVKAGVKADKLFAQICDAKGVDAQMRNTIAVEIRQFDTAMWVAGNDP